MKKMIMILASLCLAQGALGMQSRELELVRAAGRGAVSEVGRLIKEGVDVNAFVNFVDERGQGIMDISALKYASAQGHREVVELLLDNGADVDVSNSAGFTALHSAAQSGQQDIVQLLLARGADANKASSFALTPLMLWARDSIPNEAVIDLLLKHKADINAQDNNHLQAPLHYAAGRHGDNEKLVQLLLRKGSDVKLMSADGTTPLMRASEVGNRAVVAVLLTAISDKDAQEMRKHFSTALLSMKNAEKPLGLPRDPRSLVGRALIKEYVQDRMKRALFLMDQEDMHHVTAREIACARNHQEIVDFLDPNNTASQARIRNMIEANVRRALFGRLQ